MRDYRQLKVWERSHALTLRSYLVTGAYPPDERFGLVSQTRRSVSSIPMNIAEGSGRMTRADYSRFIGYASASCNEAEYQLLLGRDLGYLADSDFEAMSQELSELRAMLTSLQRTLLRTSASS
ncbi:MAG: four helix bundle protein [Acidimicrobiia bacterium]